MLTSQIMRDAAEKLRTHQTMFVCHAVRACLQRSEAPYDYEEAMTRSQNYIHPLLRRDGLAIDGNWDSSHHGEYDHVRIKQARIDWCLKIASELEAQEYQAYLDSGHA